MDKNSSPNYPINASGLLIIDPNQSESKIFHLWIGVI